MSALSVVREKRNVALRATYQNAQRLSLTVSKIGKVIATTGISGAVLMYNS